MARVDNLSNFLTDVANAIRGKKGTTDAIPATNFDTEISSIATGAETEVILEKDLTGLVGWDTPSIDFSEDAIILIEGIGITRTYSTDLTSALRYASFWGLGNYIFEGNSIKLSGNTDSTGGPYDLFAIAFVDKNGNRVVATGYSTSASGTVYTVSSPLSNNTSTFRFNAHSNKLTSYSSAQKFTAGTVKITRIKPK